MKILNEKAKQYVDENFSNEGSLQTGWGFVFDGFKTGYAQGYLDALNKFKMLQEITEDTAHIYNDWLKNRGVKKEGEE